MKSAIVKTFVVFTTSVLSTADKSKVRVITASGIDLPLTVTRSDFEAMYENAKDMAPVIKDFIHVRVNRAKKIEGFSIIDNEEAVNTDDIDVADNTEEDISVEENGSDYLDSLIDAAIKATAVNNDDVAGKDEKDEVDVPFTFSDDELNDIDIALDGFNAPVVKSKPVKEEAKPMTTLEKAIAEMMNSSSKDSTPENSSYQDSSYEVPDYTPDYIPDADEQTEEELEAEWRAYDNFVPKGEATTEEPIDKEPVTVTAASTNDADREFVKFVHDKAVSGKYPRWTQNIDKRNLAEYAKMVGESVEDIVAKYLMANKNKYGYVTYYSVKPEFVAKYYEQACYTSPDYRWFVVVKGNIVELYDKKDNGHILNKSVSATESPDAYTKALKVLEGYTFRKGVWAE